MLSKLKYFFAKTPEKTDVFSIKGRRTYQQDNYFISEQISDIQVCFVADGVGGHAHGEYASAKVVEVFETELKVINWEKEEITEVLKRTLLIAAAQIYNKSITDSEYQGTGSTISGFLVNENQFYTFNIGDSRVYFFSDKENQLKLLTKDHSYVNDLIDNGLLSEEEALRHSKRNIINSSLGMRLTDIKIDIRGPYVIENSDILIAVTDGLTSGLTNDSIEKLISEHKNKKLAQLLVEQAFETGSSDNITALVYRHLKL